MKNRSGYLLRGVFAFCALHTIGCGPSGFLGDPATISGQISAWTKGTGYTLHAITYNKTIASAPIDAAGRFKIAMPALVELQQTTRLPKTEAVRGTPAGCTGSVESSAAEFSAAIIDFTTLGNGMSKSVSYRNQPISSDPLVEIDFIYIDSAFRQRGELSCTQGDHTSHTSYDLSLVPGLNYEVSTYTVPGDRLAVDRRSASVPGDVEWVEEE